MADNNITELTNSQKWEHCLENAFRKTTSGFLVSGLLSLVTGSFRTKLALVMLGTGIGIGMGYTECRVSFEKNIHFQKRYYAFVDVKEREPLAPVESPKEEQKL